MDVLGKEPRRLGLSIHRAWTCTPLFSRTYTIFIPTLVTNRFRPSEKKSFFLPPFTWHAARRASASASASRLAPRFIPRTASLSFPGFISFYFPRHAFHFTSPDERRYDRSMPHVIEKAGIFFLLFLGPLVIFA